MSTVVTFNGLSYIIPATGEVGWGNNVSSYLIAIAAGSLQKTGGAFTLTAEADFGASFGLKSLYYKSESANVSHTGVLRLNNNSDSVSFRNFANSADLPLLVNASNQLTFNGVPIGGTGIFTANRAIVSDGSGNLVSATTTSTEIGYVNGVTSSIQTQLNGKASTALDNLASTAVNDNVIPGIDIAVDLGSSAKSWRHIYSNLCTIGTSSQPGQLNFIASNLAEIVINAANQSGAWTYSIPDAGNNASFVLVTSFGTSGQILTSTGASTAPTFQNAAAAGANTTLSNLGTTAINASLIPDTTNSYDLGTSSSVEWRNIYAQNFHAPSGQGIDFQNANTKVSGNASQLVLTVAGTTACVIDSANFEIGNNRTLTLDTDSDNKSRIVFVSNNTSLFYDTIGSAMRFTIRDAGDTTPIEYMTVLRSNDIVQFPTGSAFQNHSGAPSSPINGQVYWDSGDTHFYGWNGTAWKQLDN